MSLEERTLVVRNFDDRVNRSLLFELFHQAGPVLNVVLRPDFAFVEFEHKISVGYAMALFHGINLFGQQLSLEPKLRNDPTFYSYLNDMNCYNRVISQKPDYFFQFMSNESVQTLRNVGYNRGNSRRIEDNYHNNRSEPYRRQSYPEHNRYSDRRRYSDRYSNHFQNRY